MQKEKKKKKKKKGNVLRRRRVTALVTEVVKKKEEEGEGGDRSRRQKLKTCRVNGQILLLSHNSNRNTNTGLQWCETARTELLLEWIG